MTTLNAIVRQQFIRPNQVAGKINRIKIQPKLFRQRKVQATESSEDTTQKPQQQVVDGAVEGDVEQKQGSLPFTASEFFGSYLQLAVWIVVLSLAFKTGLEQVKDNPAGAGLFLAPPGAALFLITTFLLYRFFVFKDDDDN
eukprot:TRINITY_DN44_c0_g1_i1.p2 TRINITY_DN44_c0_g1~~TRINITY_DN44_c0_g1_i1.p2  ORF type:complete len:159 (-),score=22.56 TRINITY_DN44_c0_g1_i1:195-617(-)